MWKVSLEFECKACRENVGASAFYHAATSRLIFKLFLLQTPHAVYQIL